MKHWTSASSRYDHHHNVVSATAAVCASFQAGPLAEPDLAGA
jgi:hypothetical protein